MKVSTIREAYDSGTTVWDRAHGVVSGLGEAAATPAGTAPGRAHPAGAPRKQG